MSYSELSDFEINKRVAEYEAVKVEREGRLGEFAAQDLRRSPRSYCNNPSDAWSIIVENNIGIQALVNPFHKTVWDSWVSNQADINFVDENPLRAAMIVYLMMQEQAA